MTQHKKDTRMRANETIQEQGRYVGKAFKASGVRSGFSPSRHGRGYSAATWKKLNP